MTKCETGRIIIKERSGKDEYIMLLNLIDTTASGTHYRKKEVRTNLSATKRNYPKAVALLNETIEGYSEVGETTLFCDYCLKWLDDKKSELETTTYEGYEYRIQHIVNYFRDNPVTIGHLTAQHVDDFYHYLLSVEKNSSAQRQEIGLSNRTVKDIATLLKAIVTKAIMLGHVCNKDSARIILDLKIPKRPETEKETVYIDADEVQDFFKALKGHRLEYAFTIALYFGLRREEIAGLKWEAIKNNRLYIKHTVTKLKTTVAKERTKSPAGKRNYPIPPEIMQMFQLIKEKQEENRRLFGDCYHESDYVFTWEDGKPYSPDYLTKSFKKLVRSSETLDSDLYLHTLRASCVSILAHENVDIKDIQDWVGHKDIHTTMNIYARTNQKEQTKTMNHMTAALFNNVTLPQNP